VKRREVRLPTDTRAAQVARRELDAALRRLSPDRRADARLLTTELVTNAFRHGRPPITLVIDERPDHVRVEVVDAGGGRPRRRPEPGADGGWGLLLVESAADRWGVADGSTSVWFEIDR
jgi:anti-sigma regulatory factor (Ser/Thr protein kinase)